MPADRPISRRSADASRRIQPPFPTSSVEVAPLQLYDELSTAQLVGVACKAEPSAGMSFTARPAELGQACRGTASHCLSPRGKASIGSAAYLSAALFGRQATALRGRRGIAGRGAAQQCEPRLSQKRELVNSITSSFPASLLPPNADATSPC
jgi:hypothetical protein